MGDKEVDDVIAGGKYLQSLPSVQKDRLAVMGDSRGAFITYCAIARPNPFKVAAAISGFTDLAKQFEYENEVAPNFGGIARLMRASPLSAPEKYKNLSPVQFVGRINVPVLIIHGNNDRLVLPEHAWSMAEGLAKSQKEHDVLILYAPEEDTGHTLKGEPLETAHKTILKWFNQHLFPEEAK
jgi:dipeptidyl aminopeptidase/acylaminoacyl peptidase